MIACSREDENICKLLVQKGADVEARDNDDWTPLHFAACGSNIEIAKLLRSKGARVSVKNKNGQTSLDLAKQQGSEEMALLLAN